MNHRDHTSNYSVLVAACNAIFSFLQDQGVDVLELRTVIVLPGSTESACIQVQSKENPSVRVQIVKPLKKKHRDIGSYTTIEMKEGKPHYRLEIQEPKSKKLLWEISFSVFNDGRIIVLLCDGDGALHYEISKEKRILAVSL